MNTYMLAASALEGILRGGLYAGVALGLSLTFGVMRFVNVAYGEFLVLSAFLVLAIGSAVGLPLLGAMAAAMPLMFLFGWALQKCVINPVMPKGLEPSLLSAFGVSIILQNVMIATWGGNTRTLPSSLAELGVSVGGFAFSALSLVTFVVGVALSLAAHYFLKYTYFGRAFRAAAQDPGAARVVGVNVDTVYALTAGCVAALAVIGGSMIGTALSFTPTSGFSWLLKGFIVVVLGGMGSISGALAGGLLLGLAEGVGGAVLGTGYRDMVGFLIFLLVLWLRPHGIFGTVGSEK